MPKTYPNSIKGYKMWDKDHPWNTSYQEEKEFKYIAGVYVECSLSDFSDGTMTAFISVREYITEEKTFELVKKEELGEGVLDNIKDIANKYAKKHNCKYIESLVL